MQVPGDGIPHPILTDVRVRRAVAFCTDRPGLIASVFPFLDAQQQQTLLMDTFLPRDHWAYTAPPSQYTYPHNPTLGQQLLDAAGWTLAPGATYRTNAAGKELALTLTTTTAGFRQTWAAALEAQLRTCGIRLVRNRVAASWWFENDTGLARRDFELGAFAWVADADPGGRTLYACDQIPTPANGWRGQNSMGWCNDRASAAIIAATRSLRRAERVQNYAVVQEEFARYMVSLPAFQRVEIAATHKDLAGFAPDPLEYDTWNAHNWALPSVNTLVLGMSWEPDTLFPLVSYHPSTHYVAPLIYGQGLTNPGYDFQAPLYQSLPTLENGGAITRTVSVSAGAKVVDANGAVVTLAIGTHIVDAAGHEVVYSGGAVDMTQLVVTGSYLDNMRWSDGSPLVQSDLRLWDTVNCDPALGATWRLQCDYTVQREYLDDATVRYTLAPGFVAPTYVSLVPGAYPSQRVLSDGRRLEEVPPAEWPNLPEIILSPIGLGPYRLISWEFGQRMTFAANPYFVLGAPRTPNIEIRFIGDSSAAVDQLLDGSVHVLDRAAISGGYEAERVLAADRAGQIKAYVLASRTWEHVDMNLAIFPKTFLPHTIAGGRGNPVWPTT
jgi:ABC-type transport system substrate-binding protein